MSKRQYSLTVSEDLLNVFDRNLETEQVKGLAIEEDSPTVIRKMGAAGLRDYTIRDYELPIGHFMSMTGAKFLQEFNVEYIYLWLSSMSVSNQTKLTRSKCFCDVFR